MAITKAVSAECRRLQSPEPQVYIMCSSNPTALSTAVGLLLVPLIQWREIGGSRPVANPLEIDGTREIVNIHLHGSFAEALILPPRWPAMRFEFTQRSPTWLFACVHLSLFYISNFSTCFQNYFFFVHFQSFFKDNWQNQQAGCDFTAVEGRQL